MIQNTIPVASARNWALKNVLLFWVAGEIDQCLIAAQFFFFKFQKRDRGETGWRFRAKHVGIHMYMQLLYTIGFIRWETCYRGKNAENELELCARQATQTYPLSEYVYFRLSLVLLFICKLPNKLRKTVDS